MGTKGEEGVVVDTDTKVYDTDNLFVVDASMHPDLPTGNTQAIVMVAAEAAVARILALGTASNTTNPSSSTLQTKPTQATGISIPQLLLSGTGVSGVTSTHATSLARPITQPI